MRDRLRMIAAGFCIMAATNGCGPVGIGADGGRGPGGPACTGVATDFEFSDASGEFTIAEGEGSVVFENGLAQTLGIPSLYRSGSYAWMIAARETGTIRIDPPALQVRLFFRDQTATNNGRLTVLDANGTVIEALNGTTSFVEVSVSADSSSPNGIATITLENDGASGFSIIDDFEACIPADDSDGDTPAATPLADPIARKIPPGDVTIALETIATGLVAPNWGIAAPGDADRLFVVDQTGQLWAIDIETGAKSIFLDVSDRLVELGAFGPESFDERGFLGVAFHPDYTTNGLLYTYTSEPAEEPAHFGTLPAGMEPNHQSVITEWRLAEPGDPASTVDPGSARVLLRIDQPQFNHNAGAINFGPDDHLYIALGDGGGADDGQPVIGHSPEGNGQDTTNPLGAVLRIDPRGTDSANGQYGIPADNPFVNTDDSPDADTVAEIFAYGLRNPFRFSFDTTTGVLYLADVGQNDIEEINIIESGGNYGWNRKEGTFTFDPNGDESGFVTAGDPGGSDNLVDPIAQYDHDEGTAIVGGFVYRGSSIPALQGRYVFGDFADPTGSGGRLFYLDTTGDIVELNLEDNESLGMSLLGFGQDASGEIYVLGNATGTPFGDTGLVLRMTDAN